MKKIIAITSVINPTTTRLCYTDSPRTAFSPEERINQTIYTISCLKNLFPDAVMYLIDASKEDYSPYFICHSNVVTYVNIHATSPELYDTLNNHINKSYSEAVMLDWFVSHYRAQIEQHSYFLKVSGRYFFENVDTAQFNEHNINKFFIKSPNRFDWIPGWEYQFSMIDRRSEENNNVLSQYSTVMYGLGTKNLNIYQDMLHRMKDIMQHEHLSYYSVELLLYYFVNTLIPIENINTMSWTVVGWEGPSRRFMYY